MQHPAEPSVRLTALSFQLEVIYMATNGSKGDGRLGAVRGRSQAKNTKTGLWTKRDTSTGRFMNVKKSGGTFKGIKRER
jgi:hypothetical protein